MCIICIEIDKNKLSSHEARRNLGEMVEKIGFEHAKEVDKKISELVFHEIDSYCVETLAEIGEICEFCEISPCDCNWETFEWVNF